MRFVHPLLLMRLHRFCYGEAFLRVGPLMQTCFFITIVEPDEHRAGNIHRAIGSDKNSYYEAERETVNALASPNVKNHHGKLRGEGSKQGA